MFHAGRLFAGGTGERLRRGADLGCRVDERVGRAAHFTNHAGEMLGSAIGTALDTGKQAGRIAMHTLGQIALGKRVKQLDHFLQPLVAGVEQAVHVGAEGGAG